MGFDSFIQCITRTPHLGSYPVAMAWGVLGAEVVVSLLLIWPDTNRLGLWGALGLMVAFTSYIALMMLFVDALPCHCGGAIEKLTWGQHLLFNCGFIALASGLLLYHYKVNLKHSIHKVMQTIASKIKKAAFGMMVALLAVGFSAFTVGSEKKMSGLNGLHWYYHLGNNQYEYKGQSEMQPDQPCPPVDDDPEICIKGFEPANNPGLSGAAAATGDVEIERERTP